MDVSTALEIARVAGFDKCHRSMPPQSLSPQSLPGRSKRRPGSLKRRPQSASMMPWNARAVFCRTYLTLALNPIRDAIRGGTKLSELNDVSDRVLCTEKIEQQYGRHSKTRVPIGWIIFAIPADQGFVFLAEV